MQRQNPGQITEYRPAKGQAPGMPQKSHTSGAPVRSGAPGRPAAAPEHRAVQPAPPQRNHAQAMPSQRSTAQQPAPPVPPKGPSNRTLVIILAAVLAALMLALTIVFGALGKEEEQTPPKEPDNSKYIMYDGKEYKYDDSRTNILFMGIDKSEAMDVKDDRKRMGFSDAMLLVSLDPEDKTMDIIAIPRETLTPVMVVDEEGNQLGRKELIISFAYGYGTTLEQSGQLAMNTVSELMYGIPIDKYCAVNFNAVPVLNDEVGGVDVEVLEDLTNLHPEFIKGSTVHLDGQMAFDYVHYRDVENHGTTLLRMDRQKQYILAYLQKMKTFADDSVESLYDLYERLGENMNTNITTEDMVALTNSFSEVGMEQILLQRIPGESKPGEEYGVYYDVYIKDDAALQKMVIDIFYEEVKETANE